MFFTNVSIFAETCRYFFQKNQNLQDSKDKQRQLNVFSNELKDSDSEDYNVRSQQELSEMMSSTNEMMTILLVSVTERTREIGLRMSIGARGVDILTQFLIESIIISVTGGIIGVIFGAAASFCVKILLNWPVSIQIFSVILSFVVCSVTGIFFGWYPAKKAANLDPIEALRYE